MCPNSFGHFEVKLFDFKYKTKGNKRQNSEQIKNLRAVFEVKYQSANTQKVEFFSNRNRRSNFSAKLTFFQHF